MYKTILALALIATVAFAYSDAQRYFPNDDVDYVIQGKNGRPLGISLVNMDEGEYLQEPEEEYLDDDEDFEDIDSIDQDADDVEDMIFMWNHWRSNQLGGACWRNGYSRGLAVGGVYPGCGFGFYGMGVMCYANSCPIGYHPCGGLCSPINVPCTGNLNTVQGMVGDCIGNQVAGNAGVFFPGLWSTCSKSNNPLGFCPKATDGKTATKFGTAQAKNEIAAAQMQTNGRRFIEEPEYLLLEQGGQRGRGQGPNFSLNQGNPAVHRQGPTQVSARQSAGPQGGVQNTKTQTTNFTSSANAATFTGLAAVALLTKYFY